MADISKIKVDDIEYDVKDATARNSVANAFKYVRTIWATNIVDANSLVGVGAYKISLNSTITPSQYHYPGDFGILIVIVADEYRAQIFVGYTNVMYTRTSTNGGTDWTSWKSISAT